MTTIISLAPGQNSFYDAISGIHLTVDNKEAKVSNKANIDGLLRAVKAGKILVVSGSLESDALAYQESLKAVPTYFRLLAKKQKQIVRQNIVKAAEISEPVKETKEETPAVVETVVEPIAEVKVDVVVEEPVTTEAAAEEVVEAAPKKRTRKKKEAETKED